MAWRHHLLLIISNKKQQGQVQFLHEPNKGNFLPIVLLNVPRWGESTRGRIATLQVFLPPVVKYKEQEFQNESPPWRARAAFNKWPLQLLTHHTYRLYSSCMCWNYKSLKSHFENTIKTFFSDCHNLPSYKT